MLVMTGIMTSYSKRPLCSAPLFVRAPTYAVKLAAGVDACEVLLVSSKAQPIAAGPARAEGMDRRAYLIIPAAAGSQSVSWGMKVIAIKARKSGTSQGRVSVA